MSKATLVIMAAGMGSRFGGGIKQLAPVGPGGEIIMDYSIYDAIEAGFDKVVFVIRRDLEETFREVIGNRIEKQVEVAYAYQETEDIPEKYQKKFAGRTKPWGTGQAVLSCKGIVKEPFAVINADDYYGKEAFVRVHDYLVEDHEDTGKFDFCMAGFILGNTLSDNGAVTRGVCKVENGYLTDVVETGGIEKLPDGGAGVPGPDGKLVPIDAKGYVSMNMWGLTPDFLDEVEKGFKEFLQGLKPGDIKAEYLLPSIIGGLLKEGRATVKVLETHDRWFGVTYKEDKQSVVDSFKKLIADGVYKEKLFS